MAPSLLGAEPAERRLGLDSGVSAQPVAHPGMSRAPGLPGHLLWVGVDKPRQCSASNEELVSTALVMEAG